MIYFPTVALDTLTIFTYIFFKKPTPLPAMETLPCHPTTTKRPKKPSMKTLHCNLVLDGLVEPFFLQCKVFIGPEDGLGKPTPKNVSAYIGLPGRNVSAYIPNVYIYKNILSYLEKSRNLHVLPKPLKAYFINKKFDKYVFLCYNKV